MLCCWKKLSFLLQWLSDEFNPQKKPLDQSCVECQQDLMASDVGYEAAAAAAVRSEARLCASLLLTASK